MNDVAERNKQCDGDRDNAKGERYAKELLGRGCCMYRLSAHSCPTKTVKKITPPKAWNSEPDVEHLWIFRSFCTCSSTKAKRKRVDDCGDGEKCIFIDYSEECKPCKLYDSHANKIVGCGSVTFTKLTVAVS